APWQDLRARQQRSVPPTGVYAWSFEFSIGYETSQRRWLLFRNGAAIDRSKEHLFTSFQRRVRSARRIDPDACASRRLPTGRSKNPAMRHRLPDVKNQFRILNWFLIENIEVGGHCFRDFRLSFHCRKFHWGDPSKKMSGKRKGVAVGEHMHATIVRVRR